MLFVHDGQGGLEQLFNGDVEMNWSRVIVMTLYLLCKCKCNGNDIY